MNFIRRHLQWRKFHGWSSRSINRSIFGAAVLIALLSFFVKMASVFKDVEVARVYGVSDDLDAFLMAFMIPSFAVSVFTGSLYSSFSPVLISTAADSGLITARRLFSNIFAFTLITLGIVTAILYLSGDWLLRLAIKNFSADKVSLTTELYYQSLLFVFVGGLAGLGSSVLNAEKKFAWSAISPLFTPVAIIFMLHAGLMLVSPDLLVTGTLVGASAETLLIFYGVWRIGYLCFPSMSGWDQSSSKVLKQYFPMMAGAFLMSGTVIIDQTMATWLESGSVSVLNYALKIPAFVTGLASVAIGTAILPYLSQQIAEKDFEGLSHTLDTYVKVIFTLSFVVVMMGIYFSHQVVELLFQRGAFDRAETEAVGYVLIYALIQVPFYILGTLLARFVSALEKNRLLMHIAIVSLLSDIVFNYVLMHFMGVAGIALSTAVVYFISMSVMYLVVKREIRLRAWSRTGSMGWKI